MNKSTPNTIQEIELIVGMVMGDGSKGGIAVKELTALFLKDRKRIEKMIEGLRMKKESDSDKCGREMVPGAFPSKKFEVSTPDLKERIKNAIHDEYDEHDTCHYEMGCVLSSETLDTELDKIISQERESWKREVLEMIDKQENNWNESEYIGAIHLVCKELRKKVEE